MPPLASRILARLRSHGPAGLLHHAGHHLSELYNERRLGIRTSGHISPTALGLGPLSKPYAPVSYRSFRAVMAGVHLRAGRDVFLDYGAGKGRAVVLAATYPFRRVVGVEISPKLSALARENTRRASRRLLCPVEIVTADAAEYPLPDEVTVVHLFDPFEGPVLVRVFESIHESLRRSPRALTILYADPHHLEDLLPRFPWLMRRADVYYPYFDAPDRERCKYTIYEATG
jgi:SAM-dependent methyltransferase